METEIYVSYIVYWLAVAILVLYLVAGRKGVEVGSGEKDV